MFFSLALLFLFPVSAKACLSSQYEFSVLLSKAPKNLHNASFVGKVNINRVTDVNTTTIVRATVRESSTHPHFVGKKVMFFYENTFSCTTSTLANDAGFAMGKALKLGQDVLVVDPYLIRGEGEEEFLTREQMQETLREEAGGWGIREVYTDEEVIPLWKFYFDDLNFEKNNDMSSSLKTKRSL